MPSCRVLKPVFLKQNILHNLKLLYTQFGIMRVSVLGPGQGSGVGHLRFASRLCSFGVNSPLWPDLSTFTNRYTRRSTQAHVDFCKYRSAYAHCVSSDIHMSCASV